MTYMEKAKEIGGSSILYHQVCIGDSVPERLPSQEVETLLSVIVNLRTEDVV